jgi:hypothetical protein
MKTVLFLVTILLLGVIGLVLFKSISEDQPGALENLPVIDQSTLAEMQQKAAQFGSYLSWGVIGASIVLQLTAWGAASRRFHAVRKMGVAVESKLKMLENIEVYFDLPLYFGLLGTVVSFILITVFPDAGLMFAYVSTGLGIIVSISLRLLYITPYKQLLIEAQDRALTDAEG